MSEDNPYGQGKPISININDWINERRQPDGSNRYPGTVTPYTHPSQIPIPQDAPPEEVERVKHLQEKLRRQWAEREDIAMRENALDKAASECVECGENERHYIGDYMCYRCRDKIDPPGSEFSPLGE